MPTYRAQVVSVYVDEFEIQADTLQDATYSMELIAKERHPNARRTPPKFIPTAALYEAQDKCEYCDAPQQRGFVQHAAGCPARPPEKDRKDG